MGADLHLGGGGGARGRHRNEGCTNKKTNGGGGNGPPIVMVDPLSYFSFQPGLTKAVVCAILSVRWCI